MRHKVSDDAVEARHAAGTEAERLDRRGYLGCEHLLLGLLSHDTTMLNDHGVSLDDARREVVRIYGDAHSPLGRRTQGARRPRARMSSARWRRSKPSVSAHRWQTAGITCLRC